MFVPFRSFSQTLIIFIRYRDQFWNSFSSSNFVKNIWISYSLRSKSSREKISRKTWGKVKVCENFEKCSKELLGNLIVVTGESRCHAQDHGKSPCTVELYVMSSASVLGSWGKGVRGSRVDFYGLVSQARYTNQDLDIFLKRHPPHPADSRINAFSALECKNTIKEEIPVFLPIVQ